MKPILYAADETAFISNGMGRLSDVQSCVVTEERNGIYLCEFTISVTSPSYSLIQEGRYIAVTHDDKHDIQPFEIYGRSAPIDGVVTFYAHHLSYKLANVIVKPFEAASCAQALTKFETETYTPQPFTFWTDKNVSANFKNDVPSSCRSLLAGQEGSILDVYGTGEYEFDKWAVKLHLHRGADNGVTIRYGVNLTDILQDVDESGSYSAVAPYWKSEDGATVVTLPEGYIVADNPPIYRVPWTTNTGEFMQDNNGNIIEFAVPVIKPVPVDFTEYFQNPPTVEQLRQLAKQKLESSEAWLPSDSITVSFVDLAHTEDYKAIAALQRVSLCDRVNVYCGPLGVHAVSMQVIRTVYNVLTDTYNSIELGTPRTNFADTILADINKRLEQYPSTGAMQAAIEHATQLITGGLGGYVILKPNADGEPEELLIMDTPDTSTAVEVWRWNKNGLGHSHNGYDGPFDDVALTADGQINASMITTGYLLATLIKGGTLLLGGYDNANGLFVIQDANGNAIVTGDKDGITVSKGIIAGPTIKVGGLNNSDGVFEIRDANGNVIVTGNKDGLTVNKGTIAGPLIKAGGANNANGQIQVIDASGNVIGTWNNAGLTLNKGSIVGPSITVGGNNNVDGYISVRNASNVEICRIDRNGIVMNAGSINIGNGAFTVNTSGVMSASGASLNGFFECKGERLGVMYTVDMSDGMIRLWAGNSQKLQLRYNGESGYGLYGNGSNTPVSIANVSTNSGGAITGGAYVSVDRDGEIDLRGSSIKVGGVTEVPQYGDNGTYQYVEDIQAVKDSDGYVISVYPTYGYFTVKNGIIV